MLFIASLPNINILSFTDNTNNCDVAIMLLMEIQNLSMQKNGLCIISIVINLHFNNVKYSVLDLKRETTKFPAT